MVRIKALPKSGSSKSTPANKPVTIMCGKTPMEKVPINDSFLAMEWAR